MFLVCENDYSTRCDCKPHRGKGRGEGFTRMDYRKSAQEVLELVGGADNIASAAHCATRLRLVIADNSKISKEAIEQVDGVKGAFEAQGQLQIIFGTGTVNKVFEEFCDLSDI